ncbi:MAG: hypothetical protein IJO06_11585 [Thermoguttaceae bacterium]|nr:hypothetical protein [Thermoguttaceae bacterium]MBQ7111845.1 hypothetical protein [Thermoguttaceae bacterium]
MNSPIRPDDAYFSELDDELDDYASETDAELDPLDEEIAAYLDDELDPKSRAAFERRLADEPELRARVDAERSAWNALSLLDVAAPDERLPDAVVERLDSETQTELLALTASLRRRRALRALFLASTALLLAALGFGVFSLLFPDVQTRRERDFRVVERLAQLEIVGDFDYLTALDASGLFAPTPTSPPPFAFPNNARQATPSPTSFAPPADASAPPPPPTPKTFEELAQDRVFYRLQQKFERLDPQTRERRRALYRQIADAPNADALWRLLDRYCAWFASFPSDDDREKLLVAPIPERLEIVRRYRDFARRFAERQRDAANRFAPLPPPRQTSDDAERRRADSPQIRAFRDALPEELRDENLDAIGQKYAEFLNAKRGYGGRRENALAFLTEESSEKIVAALSEKARVYLRDLSEEERSAALGLLVTLGFWEREERSSKPSAPFPNVGRGAPSFGAQPFARDAQRRDFIRELAETLRKLPPERRDPLTSLPADEMRGFLWATHWRFAFRNAERSQRSAGPNSPETPPFAPDAPSQRPTSPPSKR